MSSSCVDSRVCATSRTVRLGFRSVNFPRAFGPFELQERIGVGGMAEVFRATAFGASGFEKTVAIKALREEHVGDATFERMFFDEARLHATLMHRGLVQAHDCGSIEGRPWVRLDYVDGGDLDALRNGRVMSEPLACFVLAELLTTLAFVHRATDSRGRELGLVHRDVSAPNVLLSRAGEVKLGDFGIAKATLLKERTRSGVRKGSAAYMSPEQVSGRALSATSDVFSAGALFVELITGSRPFDGADPLETMDRIREAPPRLDGLSADQRALVAPMLEKDATLRPTASTLVRAFRNKAADEADLAQWVSRR